MARRCSHAIGPHGLLDKLYVLSRHRKQGHATRILEAAVAHAKDLRPGGIRLLVEPENAAAPPPV